MRVLINETITGLFVEELPFTQASWSNGICRADTVGVTLPGYIGVDYYKYMVPRKFTLSVVDDDNRVKGAGVLGIPESSTDDDGINRLAFEGSGPESLYAKRVILPYPYWPLVNAAGYPVAARNTRITGVDYGTMMKKLYQQAMSHPGGAIPVAWQADRAGTREKEWAAVEGKKVQEAVEDISQLLGGVEWKWVPQLDDNDNLSWGFITAPDSSPELTTDSWHIWQVGGNSPDVRNLNVKITPELMCHTAIFAGGKDDDRVMLSRTTGTVLLNAGIPLSEEWDTSHSSVSVQATLDSWATQRWEDGQAPIQYWTFDVRANQAMTLTSGDWCTLEVFKHWLLPDGSYPRRVVSVAGTVGSDWLKVTVAGVSSW